MGDTGLCGGWASNDASDLECRRGRANRSNATDAGADAEDCDGAAELLYAEFTDRGSSELDANDWSGSGADDEQRRRETTMSRVVYTRPFSQVGFRPYRKTTPFIAAHGLGNVGDDGTQDVTISATPLPPHVEALLAAGAIWFLFFRKKK